MKKQMTLLIMCISLILICGCGAMKTSPVGSDFNKGFQMTEDKDIGKVYLAEGFNFKGYDCLLVLDPSTASILPKAGVDPEEMKIYLKSQLLKRLGETGVFPKVTDDTSILTPKDEAVLNILILESTFTEVEPGNRALRAIAGFGAGAAKVQVETAMKDAKSKKVLFVASDRRVDPGAAGMGGLAAAVDSKGLLTNVLDTIVKSLCSFMQRIASGGKIE